MHKREPKTVKMNRKEEDVVARAARIKDMAPATFLRLYGVGAARRIVRRHQAEKRKETAARVSTP